MSLGITAQMGPLLRREVEKQLLADLVYYGICQPGLRINWSDACQEGHCTRALDGNLEELSEVMVEDSRSDAVAKGWMDFIHGGGDRPLFVFWLFLSLHRDGKRVEVKSAPTIPAHLWSRLPDHTKRLCARAGEYDDRWSDDPLVREWSSNAPSNPPLQRTLARKRR
jgi:hypothetical protein